MARSPRRAPRQRAPPTAAARGSARRSSKSSKARTRRRERGCCRWPPRRRSARPRWNWACSRFERVAKEEGLRRLDALAAVRTFASPDDYFRLARAARAVREYLLANDAYQRIAEVPRADIQAERGDLFLPAPRPGDAVARLHARRSRSTRNGCRRISALARALADENPPAAAESARRRARDCTRTSRRAASSMRSSCSKPTTWRPRSALDRFAKVKPGSLDELRSGRHRVHRIGPGRRRTRRARIRERNPTSALGYRTAAEQARARLPLRRCRGARSEGGGHRSRRPDRALRSGAVAAAHRRRGRSPSRPRDVARVDRSASQQGNQGGSQVTKNLLEVLDTSTRSSACVTTTSSSSSRPKRRRCSRPTRCRWPTRPTRRSSTRYGFKPQGPILIEIFPNHDDFAVRTLGLPGLVGALGRLLRPRRDDGLADARGRRASSAGRRRSGTSWRTCSRCSSRSTACRAG